jgi:signal transduction histidine kinase
MGLGAGVPETIGFGRQIAIHLTLGMTMEMSLANIQHEIAPTRVLVVDDCAADRNLLRLSLLETPHHYNLEFAERLSEGLEKLRSQPFDVLLLDLDLPDSKGNETVKTVISKAPGVPILILSGSDNEPLALKAVRAGAQDYIVKGRMDSHALTRAMHHAIERHQVITALRETRQKQLDFKDKFLSHVSHELRSPLACIHQFTEVILEGLAGPVSDKEREYLQSILRNAKQLNNLINDLLDGASASVGKLTIEPARVDATDLMQQVALMLRPKAKARGVELATAIGNHIPFVKADWSRLQQIFINLVENAIRFTDVGGEITLRATIFVEDPRFVEFSVADTGKGIDPENLEQIFDRLYQEQTAASNHRGLGLGLAICKELVEQHGGRIWATSKLGKGSVFNFTLPVFSLSALVYPILVRDGRVQNAMMIAIEIARGTQPVADEVWELTRRRSRAIVERCLLPVKDLLLPSMSACQDREVMFIIACIDMAGAAVLKKRILGELTAAPQIANSCIYQTSCITLPMIPDDKLQLNERLDWVCEMIEREILKLNSARNAESHGAR